MILFNASCKPCFLIGNPVDHSKSPQFQNAAFQYHGVNSVYLALNVQSNDFSPVISALKKIDLFGLNITIPYKLEIMNYIDSLSQEAKEIQSVNTVVAHKGEWIGHNTDWYGVYQTLKINQIDLNQQILIIGAGGATNGLIFGLKKYGFDQISITNRTMNKAEKLAKQYSLNIEDFQKLEHKSRNYSFIINSTARSFTELLSMLNPDTIYYDLKYYKDQLKNYQYIDGKDMLLYQGALAFQLWTGIEPDIEIMKNALYSSIE
ncbi:MAG: shikimate dehydrogenase [Spirochaetes bacterium]|nr:shikimate dehydrogenase [Spirochaetota bacterium]